MWWRSRPAVSEKQVTQAFMWIRNEIAGSRWAIEECFERTKELTGLNEYEVRHLLVKLVFKTIPETEYTLDWSDWRRHHQHVAKLSQYKTRGHDPPKQRSPTVALVRLLRIQLDVLASNLQRSLRRFQHTFVSEESLITKLYRLLISYFREIFNMAKLPAHLLR